MFGLMVNNICYVLGTSGPRFLFFVLRRLAIGILFLSIPLDESLLIRLLVRCLDMLFPVRTPLHNLFAFVHPKVVSVFSKLSSQRFNGYYNFCYHISPFFVLLRIESVVSSRPFRDHRVRPCRIAYLFPKTDAKVLLFPDIRNTLSPNSRQTSR